MATRLRAILDDPPDAADTIGRLREARGELLRRFVVAAKRGSPEAPEIVVALDPVLVLDAPRVGYERLLERALVIAPSCDPETHAGVLRAHARLATLCGRHRIASRALARARELWPEQRERERPIVAALLRYAAAHAAMGEGRCDDAEREAIAIAGLARATRRAPGAARVEALAGLARAMVLVARGREGEARDGLESAIDLARRARADRTLAIALATHGACLAACGAIDAGALSLHKSLALFRALGDRIHTTRVRADLLLARPDLDAHAALDIAERAARFGDERTAASVIVALLERGDPAAIRDHAPSLITRVWALLARVDAPDLDARALSIAERWDRSRRDDKLFVAPDGRAAERGASKIDLRARKALPHVLRALAAARIDRPGEHLDVTAIFEAGWPDERAQHHAASARVYMAIRALRGLGLQDVIGTSPAGYRIEPSIEVEWLSRRGI